MIIAISGYIHSGKDTVGKIIQFTTSEDVSYGGGWNSFLMDVGMGVEPHWQIKKFAAKLKQIASILTGIPVEKFEDQEFKKSFLPKEWNYTYRLPRISLDQENIYYEEDKQMTVREFLQRLGTEAMRDGVHKNTWVNALFADYQPFTREDRVATSQNPIVMEYPDWVITDCRFPNEAEAVKERGGVIVRINRELPQADYQTLEQRHPSETSLDDWDFDYTLDNNGTIEELIPKVRKMLEYFNIKCYRG